MKISELTNEQLDVLAFNIPHWMAFNIPNWMADNRPEWMAENRPHWMIVNRPDWMADNRMAENCTEFMDVEVPADILSLIN